MNPERRIGLCAWCCEEIDHTTDELAAMRGGTIDFPFGGHA